MKVYVYQAALLCEDCGVAVCKAQPVSDDSGKYPQGPYDDGGGVADSPQHCDHCNVFLENPLTPDGVAYAMDQWIDRDNKITRQWKAFYSL